MTIAGFDPGTHVFGIGIVRKEGSQMELVMTTQIVFPKSGFNEKMMILIKTLNELFDRFQIDEAAIEDGFLGKNVSSMNILSKVRGVVLATILNRDKELYFYSPREIKIAVTGNGNAGKEQVKKGVEILLKIKKSELGHDESDAAAVALCHLMARRKGDFLK